MLYLQVGSACCGGSATTTHLTNYNPIFITLVLSREAARKNEPLVTLDLNLTFMQKLAVKHIKLIIQNGTNGNLAIT